MKILVALHQCMDLGGIINHTEQLIGGLKDIGHDVDLKEFVYADSASATRKEGEFHLGPSGIPHHQGKGWQWQRRERVAYKTWAGLQAALQIIKEYDLVIWTVPVPSKNRQNIANNNWPSLYKDHNVRQIAFVHDGNLQSGYPHIAHILSELNGLACVHGAALGSTNGIKGIEKQLILNPQHEPLRNYPDFSTKKPGFFNMQTFKAWKHAHELIGAIRYLPPKVKPEMREVVGKGIEYQYMTSEDKCKPQYFHENGQRFWDAALENGMVHHDYMDHDKITIWLQQARVLVDPSWSKKYSKLGGHWNRVAVEGMMNGCVVVAHSDGMGNDLFAPGMHYIDLKPARDLQDYAEILIEAWNTPDAEWYRSNCRDMLAQFDRVNVAKQVMDLAGATKGTVTVDAKLNAKSEDIMFEHFGVI